MSRITPPRPWTPLSDAAWAALRPHLPPLAAQGRRTADPRARLDAIFHLAHQRGAAWRQLPARFGRPETVARCFRRLTHAGFWHALLRALAAAPPGHPPLGPRPGRGTLRALDRLLRDAAGRARIPRSLRLGWA